MSDLSNDSKNSNSRVFGELANRLLATDAQYVFFGDSSHRSELLLNFYTSRHFIESLSIAGFDNIGIEFPTQLQGVLDMYMSEIIHRKTMDQILCYALKSDAYRYDVQSRASKLLNLVDSAKQYGMGLLFLDGGEGTYEQHSILSKLETMMYSDLALKIDTREIASIDNDVLKEIFSENIRLLTPDQQTRFKEEIESQKHNKRALKAGSDSPDHHSKESFEDRYSKDYLVAERIREASNNGERIAVVYGAGHLHRKENDIDDVLGQDQTHTIMMFAPKYVAGRSAQRVRQLVSTDIADGEYDDAIIFFDDSRPPEWLKDLRDTELPQGSLPHEFSVARSIIENKQVKPREGGTNAVKGIRSTKVDSEQRKNTLKDKYGDDLIGSMAVAFLDENGSESLRTDEERVHALATHFLDSHGSTRPEYAHLIEAQHISGLIKKEMTTPSSPVSHMMIAPNPVP